jgi:hypothetical protein
MSMTERRKKGSRLYGLALTALVLFILGVLAGQVWVVAHFVRKFW